jgi:heme A synthase
VRPGCRRRSNKLISLAPSRRGPYKPERKNKEMNTLFLAQMAFNAGALIHLLILLIVVGLILWIVWWAISQIPMPEPIATVVRVIFVLVVVLILLSFLLPLLGVKLT